MMFSLNLNPLTAGSSSSALIYEKQNLLDSPRNCKLNLQTSSLFESIFTDVVASLRICTENINLKVGSCLHAKILKSGLNADVFISNYLLDMYVKFGRTEDAAELLEHMPKRTVVSWTSVMSGYRQKGLYNETISLFWQMLETLQPNEHTLAVLLQACAQKSDPKLVEAIHCYTIKCGFVADNFLQNSLIDAYAECGRLEASEKLLERFSCRDVVSWTSIISGCVLNGMPHKALALFFQMQKDGVIPNEVTFLSVLRSCSSTSQEHILQWIHGLLMKAGYYGIGLVMNSLVEMYCANGHFQDGRKIFCDFCFEGKDHYLSYETMAALLQGCAHSGSLDLGEEIHGYLIKHGFFPCSIIENSLMNLYAENGCHGSAFQLFKMMSVKDIVSWNTMITCLLKNERSSEALRLLSELNTKSAQENIFPDFITVLTSLQACSNLASLRLGQVIHGHITRAGFLYDVFVQNSLIDMYGKSGRLDLAEKIFEEMSIRDLVSWNSMIAAYGINGDGISALKLFTELKGSGIHQPSTITLVNVLSACAHAGLVEEGFEIFNSMERNHGLEKGMEHFACMVDLLGRFGRLEEAEAFIEKMPMMPGAEVWGALLGACALCSNVEIAERAAKKLSVLQPESDVWRVGISNIYAGVGKWEEAAKVRAEMRGSKFRKDGGWSSVELRGDMCRFMVADTSHPESQKIYEVLNAMQEQIWDAAVVDS